MQIDTVYVEITRMSPFLYPPVSACIPPDMATHPKTPIGTSLRAQKKRGRGSVQTEEPAQNISPPTYDASTSAGDVSQKVSEDSLPTTATHHGQLAPLNVAKNTRKRTVSSYDYHGGIIEHELPPSKISRPDSKPRCNVPLTTGTTLADTALAGLDERELLAVMNTARIVSGTSSMLQLAVDQAVARTLVATTAGTQGQQSAEGHLSSEVSFGGEHLRQELQKIWAAQYVDEELSAALQLPTSPDQRVQAQIEALDRKLKCAVSAFGVLVKGNDELRGSKLKLLEENAHVKKELEERRKLDGLALLLEIEASRANNKELAQTNSSLNRQSSLFRSKIVRLGDKQSAHEEDRASTETTYEAPKADRTHDNPPGAKDSLTVAHARIAMLEDSRASMARLIDLERAEKGQMAEEIEPLEQQLTYKAHTNANSGSDQRKRRRH